MHIVHVLEAGKVDLKQWMLDAFEEEAYVHFLLFLFLSLPPPLRIRSKK